MLGFKFWNKDRHELACNMMVFRSRDDGKK